MNASKAFSKGQPAKKHGRHRVWVAFWWEDGFRQCKTLGRQSQMTKSEAEGVLSAILRTVIAVQISRLTAGRREGVAAGERLSP
jgi:hypothetical protein